MRWEEWPPIFFPCLRYLRARGGIPRRRRAATCRERDVANSRPRAWRHRARASDSLLSIASRDRDKQPRRLLFVLSDIQDRKTIMFVKFSRHWPLYCTCAYTCTCDCVYARVYVSITVYECVCVSVCPSVCLYVWMCKCLCLCRCFRICVYMCLWASVHLSVCTHSRTHIDAKSSI